MSALDEVQTNSRQFVLTFTKLTETTRARARVRGTWSEVSVYLKECRKNASKDAVTLYSCGVVREDLPPGASLAKEDALESTQMCIVDLDGGSQELVQATINRARELGLTCLAHPTYSWTAESPRWRLIVPYARNIPVHDAKAAARGLAALLQLSPGEDGVDPCMIKPAQRYYLHSCHPDAAEGRPDVVELVGKMVDPSELIAIAGDEAQPIERAAPSHTRPGRFTADDLRVNAELYGPKPDAEMIAIGCAALRHFRDTGCAAKGERGLWLLMLAGLRHCAEGEVPAHRWSAVDTRYSHHETAKVLASLTAGPPTCAKVADEFAGCRACPHLGGAA